MIKQQPAKEFLFIDANVTDKQTLIAGVAANVKIVELNDKTNALNQIASALKGVKNLDAIHIISHGSEGELAFANGTLNSANLSTYKSQLKKIGASLSKDGDLLLYGCEVAKGDDGQAFINSLAKMTKADVAASIDFTGAASLNGDWNLEANTGVINEASIQAADWQSVLVAVNTPPTFTTLSVLANGMEDTQKTITLANLKAAGNEADTGFGNSVVGFVVQAVSTGTLKIGTSSSAATDFNASTNATIDTTHFAYWTPAANINGNLNAFTIVAKDNGGLLSTTPVQAVVEVAAVNDVPTFTNLLNITGGIEDTQNQITLADLIEAGNEGDIDGTVNAFVVQTVSTGTLKIGTSSSAATDFNASTNATIDATHFAYWTPAKDANGNLNAFTVKAKENGGWLSTTPVQAIVEVAGTNEAPVMKFADGKWTTVGIAAFSSGAAFYQSLVLAADGTPYLAYSAGIPYSALSVTNSGKATVMKFDGTTWTEVGVAASTGAAYHESLVLAADGTPYLAYEDRANSNKATVMKFINGAWTAVGGAAFSSTQASYESLVLAADGTPYLAYSAYTQGQEGSIVKKFNGAAWVDVLVSTGAKYQSLVVAADGTPYLAYQDLMNSAKAVVMKFNGTTWTEVGGGLVSHGSASYESLAIAADGTPYLAYSDMENGSKATVMKFNGTAWTAVGTGAVSQGISYHQSLAIAADGTPYLAYSDIANGSKSTVMKFNGTTWTAVGTGAISSTAYYQSLVLAADGTPYLAYSDSARATVKKFVGNISMSGEQSLTTLLGGAGLTYTDLDSTPLRGVAITKAGGTGTWQYSTDSGSTWNNLGSTWTDANALLLAETNTKLRYLGGTVSDSGVLTFRAWDQTSGTATSGSTTHSANTTVNGNASAFSVVAGTFTAAPIVNNPPTLTAIGTLAVPTSTAGASSMTISYADLQAAAKNAADEDGDAISFRIESIGNGGILTKNGAAVTLGSTLLSSGESLVWTPPSNASATATATAFSVKAFDGMLASANAIAVKVALPTLTSATYDALYNTLKIYGSNFASYDGSRINLDGIDVSKLKISIDGTSAYALTSSSNGSSLSRTGGGYVSFLLNLTDELNIEGMLNNGSSTFALTADGGWDTSRLSTAYSLPNKVTVSNVQKPTITNATYDASTGVLSVTGKDFVKQVGTTNDIDVTKLTLTGEGGSVTLTSNTANVEVISATTFSVTLGATDKAAVNAKLNKAGESSTSNTIYNLAAADDWNGLISPASGTDISDLTGNAITVTGLSLNQAPTFGAATQADITVLNGANAGLTVLEDDPITVISSTVLKAVDTEQATVDLVYKVSSLPTKGTLSINNVSAALSARFTQADIDNNLIKFTPSLNANGADSFGFQVRDGAGGILNSQTFSITITPQNDLPTASNDTATVLEAGGVNNGTNTTPVTGNVKTNDTDVDNTLTISAIRTGSSEGNGTAGTLGNALAGTYGALTLNADGSYSYAVDNSNATVDALKTGETLTENFNYTVTDGTATDTAVLAITIQGANDAPTVSNLNADVVDFWLGSTSAMPIDVGQNMTLTDPDSANYNAGTLSIGFGQSHVLGTGSFTVDGTNFLSVSFADGDTADVVLGFIGKGITEAGDDALTLGEKVGYVTTSSIFLGTRYTFNSIGTVASSNADGFSITLNANATPAQIQAFIRDVYFQESLSDTTGAGARSFEIKLTDADNTAVTNLVTLTEKIPVPTVTLTSDTGSSNSDKFTKDSDFSVANLVTNVTTTWQYSSDAGTTWFDGTGTTFTVLGEGEKTVVVRQLDVAKNASANSTPIVLTIDKTSPTVPALALTTDTGSISSDKITKESEITVSGIETGASWRYSLNAGSTWTTGTGTTISASAITSDGTKSILIEQTDKAGNVSASSKEFTFTLDTTVATPTIAFAENTGNSGDTITKNGTLNVSGLEIGATWQYSLDSGANWTDGKGSSFTLTGDGAKSVIVKQTDVAGNISANSSAFAFTLDTTIVAPTLALTDTGISSTDNNTKTGTVTLSDLETNATWEYSLNGGSTWANGTGTTHAFTGDGAKLFTVRQTDVAGNVSGNSSTLKFNLDTAIATPTIALVSDTNLTDGTTSNGKITVTGLESGATWEYSTDGTTWATWGGDNFTLTSDGEAQSITVTQTDAAGNTATSNALVVTLDTKALAPTIALANDTGRGGDKITSDGTLNVTGIETNASWEYQIGTGAWTGGTGSTITGITGDSEKSVIVRQTDLAGNVSASSAPYTFVLNSAVATKPTLALAIDTAGTSASDNITSNGTVNVTGLESGATWKYQVGSNGWLDGYGSSFTLKDDEAKSVVVKQVNMAGSESASSDPLVFTLDTSVATPTLGLNSDTGSSASDKITSDGKVNVSGLETGATWAYSTDGLTWNTGGAVVAGVSSFTFPPGNGSKSIAVRQTDVAGNISINTSPLTFILDSTNTAVAVLALNNDTGASDQITSNGVVNVSDVASGSTWRYSTDNGLNWSGYFASSVANFTISNAGKYSVVVQQLSVGGITSANSTPFNFTLDTTTTAPTLAFTDTAITNDSITSNAIVTVSGLEDGASWKYSLDNAANWTNYIGNSFTLASDGAKSILVQQTDAAGNNAINNTPLVFTLDTTIAAPTLALTNDTVITGTNSDLVTKDGSVTVSGLESGGTWRYSSDKGVNWSSWTAAATNTFELTGEGKKSVIVEQKDVAGNTSTQSTPLNFLIDTSISAPSLAFTDSEISNDAITNNGKITVSGLENGATWEYNVNSGGWTPGSGDNFSLTTDEAKSVTVRQTDLAGNVSSTSSAIAFTLDKTIIAPSIALTDDTNLGVDKITKNAAITISGIETGATWQYDIGSGWVSGTGTTITGITGDGEKTIIVKQTDVAGNISLISPKFTFNLDTTVATPTLALISDTNVNTDGVTSNGKIVVSGLESGAAWRYSLDAGDYWKIGSGDNFTLTEDGEKSVIVEQQDAAGNTATSTALAFTLDTSANAPVLLLTEDTGGNSYDRTTNNQSVDVSDLETGATWQYSFDGSTWHAGTGTNYNFTGADGVRTIRVRQTDVAGNQSTSSKTLDFTVDSITTKPTLTFVDTGTAGDRLTKDGTVTVANVETGATWEYSNDNYNWTPGSGNTVTLADDGDKTIQVRATDIAGNTQTSDILSFKLDATAATPVLWLENDTSQFEGQNNWDLVTSSGVVNVGNLEDGTWQYSLNKGDTWTTGSGSSLTISHIGTNSVIVKQTDASANVSANSVPLTFRLEGTPAAPTLGLSTDSNVVTDKITSNGTIAVSGAVPDATVQYSFDGGTNWQDSFSASSFDVSKDGAKSILARQMTVSGLTSANSTTAFAFVLDTQIEKPTLSLKDKNGTIAVSNLEAGATWQYSIDAGEHWTDSTGTEFTLSNDAQQFVIVKQTDVAGNESDPSDEFVFQPPLIVTTNLDSGDDATFGVNYNADASDGGGLSLREALHYAVESGTIDFAVGLANNTITLGTDATVKNGVTFDTNTVGTLTIAGNSLNLAGVLNVTNSTDDSLTISSNLTGADGSLVKIGAGKLTLSGTNSYAGTTIISDGVLAVSTDANLGSDYVQVGGESEGVLQITQSSDFNNVIMVAAPNGEVMVDAGKTVTLSGKLDEDPNGSFNDLYKTGGGILILASAENEAGLSGDIFVMDGEVQVANDDALPNGEIYLAEGKDIELTGDTAINNNLNLNGDANVDTGDHAVTISGEIKGGAGNDFTKKGTGTLTLSGANSFAGATSVSSGTMLLNGSMANTASVSVGNNATLGGSGTIGTVGDTSKGAVSIGSGGTLSPGNSPGIIALNNGLTLATGAKLAIQLDGIVAGTSYDQVVVKGIVNVTGATLNLTPVSSLASSTFKIIDNDGNDAVVGTFSGLTNGSVVTAANGKQFTINYAGGDGNDVTLTTYIPPAPAPAPAPESTPVVITPTPNPIIISTQVPTPISEPKPIPVVVPVPIKMVDGAVVNETSNVTTATVKNPKTGLSETVMTNNAVTEIPFVSASRKDENTLSKQADVPLATNTSGNTVLGIGVPTGVGVTSSGSIHSQTPQQGLLDLLVRIDAKTEDGSSTSVAMTGDATAFLSKLSTQSEQGNNVQLTTRTLELKTNSTTASADPIVIMGNTDANNPVALVIDVSQLPRGTVIKLDNVAFAAIVGDVSVTGGEGANFVVGDDGSQTIICGADDDTLHGGAGNDVVGSKTGNDLLYGDAGNDKVFGGEGDDSIYGGSGIDTLKGDSGCDTFGGSATDLNGDTIADFRVQDRILITGVTFTDKNMTLIKNGYDTLLNLDTNNDGKIDTSLTLRGSFANGVLKTQASSDGTAIVWHAQSTEKVFLDVQNQFILADSDVPVYGSKGYNALTIKSGVAGINVDSNVEQVNLPETFANYTFKQYGNAVYVYSSDLLIAQVGVQNDADGTFLHFNDNLTFSATMDRSVTAWNNVFPKLTAVAGSTSLLPVPAIGTAIAKSIFIEKQGCLSLANSSVNVFGARNSESVTLQAGVSGIRLDSNIERIGLPEFANAYNYQQLGNALQIYMGKSLIARVGVQDDYDGTLLDFSDGTTVSALFNSHGAMSVGDVMLTTVGIAPIV